MRMPPSASGAAAAGASAAGASAADAHPDSGIPAGRRDPQDEADGQPVGNTAKLDLAGSQNGTAARNGTAAQNGAASQNGAAAHGSGGQVAVARRTGPAAWLEASGRVARTHWLAVLLIAGGVVMRVITELAYRPAIIYIDTLKYLYGAWPGSDPVGYKIPLKLILSFGNLETVALIQHLLGIGIAITIYLVLVRRGVSRWLGALAMAPVLFDAYQLQVEAMIMPDIWFEAIIVAGLAVLLWRPNPTTGMLAAGAFILGASAGVRQVGEVFLVPVVVLAIAIGGGWRKVGKNVLAVGSAFVLALLLYLGGSLELTGHFWFSRSSASLTYGRMAAVVDCATLRIPAIERPLCPSKAMQAKGADWLEHNAAGPYRTYASTLPPSMASQANALTAKFNRAVELQQPQRVISAVLRDSVKLFAIARYTSPGDTPIWRWQFQGNFPSYLQYIHVLPSGIYLQFPKSTRLTLLNPAYGGKPTVIPSLAHFLRSYQLNGGYTPGPLLLLFLIVGLIGSVLAFFRRRLAPHVHQWGLACLTFFVTGVAVLGASDFFEFSWRYQIPALVTLPPAGAIGIAMLVSMIRRSRGAASADGVSGRAPEELATPAQ